MKRRILILLVILMGGPFAFAKQIEISVKGMVCGFCAQGISKKIQRESGVQKVDVSLEKKTVTIILKEGADIADDKIQKLLEDSGYNVEKIERKG